MWWNSKTKRSESRTAGHKDIERLRSNLKLDACERVRIVLSCEGGRWDFCIECASCDEAMTYVDARELWSCEVCSQDVTRSELTGLISSAVGKLNSVVSTE